EGLDFGTRLRDGGEEAQGDGVEGLRGQDDAGRGFEIKGPVATAEPQHRGVLDGDRARRKRGNSAAGSGFAGSAVNHHPKRNGEDAQDDAAERKVAVLPQATRRSGWRVDLLGRGEGPVG